MILAIAALAMSAQEMRILFVGNSHTALHSIPSMVKSILESGPLPRKVSVGSLNGGSLEGMATRRDVVDAIQTRRWNIVVLQGAAVSSSHKYNYSQAGAIKLAKLAEASKARALLFAEWPRKGWNESAYIYGIYKGISHASGAEIIPICYSWDKARKQRPALDLWASDGNHSSPIGGFLAALTIAAFLGESNARWTPTGFDPTLAKLLQAAAIDSVK